MTPALRPYGVVTPDAAELAETVKPPSVVMRELTETLPGLKLALERCANPTLLAAPAWYLAHDADDAGDNAALGWPARARRVRPPAPCKDWTEAFQYPINLRRWWTDRLGGIEAPALSSWDELALRRWGPAAGDPDPGIIIDAPDESTTIHGYAQATHFCS
jgi:hypothetical protein